MAQTAKLNFVRQQGFTEANDADSEAQYPPLMFQPKVVGVLVLIGLLTQSWPLFLVLSILSWWSVLVPTLNPFDAAYNNLIAIPKNRPRLTPAPAPRRFAQGMAGTFMLAVAALLFLGWYTAAMVVEAMLVMALLALLLGRFCLGSYIYHLIRGNKGFANHTLPWAHT